MDVLRAAVLGRAVAGPPLDDGTSTRLVELAVQHGVVSLVRASALRGRLSAGARERLDAVWSSEQTTRMRALADLQGVAAALHDLPWAVVKGPVLSELVYAERGRRGFGDLDVLVSPSAFETAVARLEAHGAELLDRNLQLAHRMERGELSLRLPRGTALDLHWHVVNDPRTRASLPGLATDGLLAGRRPSGVGPVLASEDALVHVLLHAVLSGGHRLVWLRDVRESVRAVPVDAVLRRAAALGVELPARVGLRRAGVALGPPRSGWEVGQAALVRAQPVSTASSRGQGLVAATRTSTAGSAAAWWSYRAARSAWWRSVPVEELRQPSGVRARDAYFAWVQDRSRGTRDLSGGHSL